MKNCGKSGMSKMGMKGYGKPSSKPMGRMAGGKAGMKKTTARRK